MKTFRNLEPVEAERALAAVTQRLLPTPDPDRDSDAIRFEPVLVELYRELGFEPTDQSVEATRKVLDALVQEMSRPVLVGHRKDEARGRLGERGDLRPDQYRIEFWTEFRFAELRGVRRSHVQQAARHPDMIEHLAPAGNGLEGMTFFTQTHGDSDSPERFILYAEAVRRADSLMVLNALRVYPSDVDLSTARTPLDVLRAFLNTYGRPFTLLSRGPTKYLIEEVIPFDGNPYEIQPEVPGFTTATPVEGRGVLRPTQLGVVHIRLAYIVDCKRYLEDLQRHRVEISPSYLESVARSNFGSWSHWG